MNNIVIRLDRCFASAFGELLFSYLLRSSLSMKHATCFTHVIYIYFYVACIIIFNTI